MIIDTVSIWPFDFSEKDRMSLGFVNKNRELSTEASETGQWCHPFKELVEWTISESVDGFLFTRRAGRLDS